MNKLALILAMLFGATGIVLAADATTAPATEPVKTEAKAHHAKHTMKVASKKAPRKAHTAKAEADKK